MGYRKFSADRIFTGQEFSKQDQVLVVEDDGTIADLVDRDRAGEDVQHLDGILSPGFVNCHCHLELSHLNGVIPDGQGMVPFLLSVMSSRSVESGVIQSAIKLAEEEMLASGIVAVGDICNTADTLPQKKKRNLYYHHFAEALGFTGSTAPARFHQAMEVYHAFNELDPGKTSVVPHAPYSVSKELFGLIDALDPEALLSIHNQESAAEEEFFSSGGGEMHKLFSAIGVNTADFIAPGKSSLQYHLPMIRNTHRLLLVHNVTTDENDLKWIGVHQQELPQLSWCLCPNANLYINGVLPDLALFRRYGLDLVVGTDSLASNYALDMMTELNTIHTYFPEVPLKEMLQWLTFNGARALGIEGRYGSFEKGKNPGLVLIRGAKGKDISEAYSVRVN